MDGFSSECERSRPAIVRAKVAMPGPSKGVSGVLLAGVFTMLAVGCARNARNVAVDREEIEPHIVARLSSIDGAYSGNWSGTWNGRRGMGFFGPSLEIVVRDGASETTHWVWVRHAEIAGLTGAKGDAVPPLALRRGAGTMTFTGKPLGPKASGDVRFVADAEFVRQAKAIFGVDATAAQTLASFVWNLQADYARSMRESGAAKTLDDALALQMNGVSADYARKLREGGGDLSVGDIVRVTRSGIGADFVVSLHRPPPAPKKPDSAKAAVAAPPRSYSIDEIIELNRHGISVQQVDALREAGYSLPAEEIIKFNRHGISNDYAKKLHEAGLQYSIDDLIELNRHGIGTDYILKMRKSGYDLSVEDMIELNRHGITTDYMAALIVPGQKNLTVAQIVELNRHGVEAEFVKRLRGTKPSQPTAGPGQK